MVTAHAAGSASARASGRASGGAAGALDWLAPLATLPQRLLAASDPSVVRDALLRACLGSPDGADSVCCTSARLRLSDAGWSVRYTATLRYADGSERVVRLSGTLDPIPDASEPLPTAASDRSAALRLPDIGVDLHREETSDDALPLLESLLDPQRAARLIERAVNRGRPASAALRISRCEPGATRYKPGSRCTVVYRVDASWADGRPAPATVVAKTYRGNKGVIADHAMRALWSSPLASSAVVRIAEPLGYLDGERLLVQGPVSEETTIKELVKDAVITDGADQWRRVDDLVDRAADALAELHGCGAVPIADDASDQLTVRGDTHLSRLAAVAPAAAAAAALVVERVSAWAAGSAPEPGVPSHGSFRPAQVLVAGNEISLIDFDGFCTAEPARDVALFCASLKVAGMGAAVGVGRTGADLARSMSRLVAAGDRFVDSYALRRRISRERVAQLEALDQLTQLVNGWTKVSQERLDGTVPLLADHLDRWLPRQ